MSPPSLRELTYQHVMRFALYFGQCQGIYAMNLLLISIAECQYSHCHSSNGYSHSTQKCQLSNCYSQRHPPEAHTGINTYILLSYYLLLIAKPSANIRNVMRPTVIHSQRKSASRRTAIRSATHPRHTPVISTRLRILPIVIT